jgi:hypothetical protein
MLTPESSIADASTFTCESSIELPSLAEPRYVRPMWSLNACR